MCYPPYKPPWFSRQSLKFFTLLKIGVMISVTPLLEKRQSQTYGASVNSNGLLTLSGPLSVKFLLHMTTSFIKENHFNSCILAIHGVQHCNKT